MAVTKVGLGKKYVDGYVLLTDDTYGGTINEGYKGNIFKYKVTDFDEGGYKFTLAYSAQAIKQNVFVWIDFLDDNILMHDVSV